ncbi:hypothetical protein N9948_01005 [bacterium]|nr:hypothetical protein [bacterium]
MKEITDFKEVFEWINYDYEQHYGLNKDANGNFYVNKLYITPTELSYKTELYKLSPGLYDKVNTLYGLFHENSVRFIKDDG